MLFLRKSLDYTILIFGIIIYFLNKRFCGYIPWQHIAYICKNHLNDFVCGLIFPAYINIILYLDERRTLKSPFIIMGVMLCCGLFWEYAAPLLIPYSVSDPFDVMCYIGGGYVYSLLVNFFIRR